MGGEKSTPTMAPKAGVLDGGQLAGPPAQRTGRKRRYVARILEKQSETRKERVLLRRTKQSRRLALLKPPNHKVRKNKGAGKRVGEGVTTNLKGRDWGGNIQVSGEKRRKHKKVRRCPKVGTSGD